MLGPAWMPAVMEVDQSRSGGRVCCEGEVGVVSEAEGEVSEASKAR